MIKEFWILLKKNIVINILLGFLVFFVTHLLFLLLHFGIAPDLSMIALDQIFEGYELFQVIPEFSFRDFEEDDEKLERLQFFYYDILLATDAFQIFSSNNNQPLIIGGQFFDVTALDLNAFNMFGVELEILRGRNFVEDDFRNFEGYFPVILGYDFSDTNQVGDVFVADYFFSSWEFEIIGILEPNQTRLHGWLSHDLDDQIILPYISNRAYLDNGAEREFWMFIYFELISSLGKVSAYPDAMDKAINVVHAGANEARLAFTIAGVHDRDLELIEIRNLVRHQQETMIVLFVSISVIMFGIITIFMSIRYRIREKNYHTLMLIGIPKWKILVPILTEIIFAFIIIFIITHEWLMFRSGFLSSRQHFSELRRHPHIINLYGLNNWWGTRRWIYRGEWQHGRGNLFYLALFIVILCIVSVIYPVMKLQKLYKNQK